jgi:transcriptional regulator with XRE-family HTH domain
MKTLNDYIETNPIEFRQEELILETTELIARVMKQNRISKSELATKLGKSKPFVSQCLSGEQNLTLRTLSDLFGAIGYRFQVGAEPLNANTGKTVSRLYPIGGWAFELTCVQLDEETIDCVPNATDEFDDMVLFLEEAA